LDEIGYCVRPNILEGTVDVHNMYARVLDKLLGKLIIHWYNDLLIRWALHGHVDLWFGLNTGTVNDLLD